MAKQNPDQHAANIAAAAAHQIANPQQIDLPKLKEIYEECFRISGDGRYSDENQAKFQKFGSQLQILWGTFAMKGFDSATQDFVTATASLGKVAKELAAVGAQLKAVADRIENLANLVAALEKLAKLPSVLIPA